MAHRARVLIDFVIVPTLESLVAEEVDGGVLDAVGEVLLVEDVVKTVRLVPAFGENVEGYLTTDGVTKRSSQVSLAQGVLRVEERTHVKPISGNSFLMASMNFGRMPCSRS